jgi:glycosyltransferase involved in cell wall biosynthesis
MTSGRALCLNMIVKNEMANLERCLSALADHIACWVIGDTGSSDGTQDFIIAFFAARGLPGELHSFSFHNFEQARNAALDHAYASPLGYDYVLFADADMELVVEDPGFRARLDAPGYRLIQRTEGSLTYWNTRLVKRDAGARYKGVTHEYVDVSGDVGELRGVWYKDYASGSNRVDKFERDIRLLTKALEAEPDNHRYWFYLAQSYKDAGRAAEGAQTYAKRADMGGWDEEAWYARLMEARCLRELGDEGGFLRQALAAYNQRPQRAEPLYDLARFYRERGMNGASVLFSEPGLALPRPEEDVLFLEDFVYTAGLKEEYAIAANYAPDPARKDRGHAACNWLALNREVPAAQRDQARSNLYFYIEPAAAMMPSFAARPVGFTPPDDYRPMNPSIARWGDQIVLVQRAVNYRLTDGQYPTANGAPIHTRNFLLRLDGDLAVQSSTEIRPPADLPEPAYPLVRGFEDVRLFAWQDALWCCACVRETTPEGWCEQVLARIDTSVPGECRLTDWRALHPPGPRLHEKNWMPQVVPAPAEAGGDRLQFIYHCDPTRVVDEQARTIVETTPSIAAEQFSGGSQAIAFDGGWLALVHEASARPPSAQRSYQHRFVWFDEQSLRRVSRAFFFRQKGVEFAAGLAWHPDNKRLLVSFGVGDGESWIATVDAGEVRDVLEDVERLPFGLPAAGHRVEKHRAAWQDVTAVAAPDNVAEPGAGGAGATEAASPDPEEERLTAHLSGVASSTKEQFLELAPFLSAVDLPAERLRLSRAFDARIAPFLNGGNTAALPQIHCFYEVLSDTAEHHSLIAATMSMRAAGHPVQVWSYSPEKLEFLLPHGIEVRPADDVLPKSLFQRIVAGSEIRYFSDIFRYAVLYEHGGLWMDTDVVLLRPFPFHGDHFLNLQWRGGHQGHFICGNVMYAKPYSRHLRNLYEMSIERFSGSNGKTFGDIGPKLLSDYIASEAGAELKDRLFSPVFFNPIDWTELDRFNQPIGELADYLNDERVFGVHLWNARTNALSRDEGASLISLLSDPLDSFPSLTSLADRFETDKNRITGNRHCYARVYDRLLSPQRLSLRWLMEIGLCRGLAELNQPNTPSAELWQTYFPFCHVIGVDLTDFSHCHNDRFSSFVCDQSRLEDVRSVAARIEPGSLDVIIDDGSHASFDQQMTFREFFPLLADGGWYFIEDLDWQPPGEASGEITQSKHLLREMQQYGSARSADPLGLSELSGQISEILFFDSHYELQRAALLGGLAAIRKRGAAGLNG